MVEIEKEGLWRSLGWREWAVIASVPVIVIGVAAILSAEFRGFINNSVTAAWAQGAGVFLAIWMTGWHQRSSEMRRRLQRLETIRIVVRDCESTLRTIRFACEKREHMAHFYAGNRHGEVELSSLMLGQLDIYDFPNALAARFFIKLRHRMQKLSGRLDGSAGTQWHTNEGAAVLRRIGSEAANAERIAELLRENLLFRGKPVRDID